MITAGDTIHSNIEIITKTAAMTIIIVIRVGIDIVRAVGSLVEISNKINQIVHIKAKKSCHQY